MGRAYYHYTTTPEIIIGIPPPHVTNLVNTIKHYLKLIYDQPDCYRDPMISYVASELQKGENSIVNSHIKESFKFLEWKAEKYPNSVSPNDVHIIQSREFANFHYLMCLLLCMQLNHVGWYLSENIYLPMQYIIQ